MSTPNIPAMSPCPASDTGRVLHANEGERRSVCSFLPGSGASCVEVRAGICLIHLAVAFWFLITAEMRAENILKAKDKHGVLYTAGQASALWSSSYCMMTPQCNCSLWGVMSLNKISNPGSCLLACGAL